MNDRTCSNSCGACCVVNAQHENRLSYLNIQITINILKIYIHIHVNHIFCAFVISYKFLLIHSSLHTKVVE